VLVLPQARWKFVQEVQGAHTQRKKKELVSGFRKGSFLNDCMADPKAA